MGNYSIIGMVWSLVWPQVIRFTLILLGAWIVPHSITNFIIIILVVNTLFDLITNDTVSFKRLFKSWVYTILFFAVVIGMYKAGGLFGALGIIAAGLLVTLAFAAWIIYQNWKVFDSVTTWGADRIRGRTKKEFDLNEAIKK